MPIHPNREILLAKKSAELNEEVARWSKEWNILGDAEWIPPIHLAVAPGDPTAIEQIFELKPADFFTGDRFDAAGEKKKNYFIRLSNIMKNCGNPIVVENRPGYISIPTMKDLLPLTSRRLLRIPQMGKRILDAMDRILDYHGLPRDEKRQQAKS